MMKAQITPSLYLSLTLTLVMVLLSALPTAFPLLSLERSQVISGEYWRLLSGNLVHFGWAHTLMNISAFLLCSFALLANLPITKFIALLLCCSLAVGGGIFYCNPEYGTYAGLSGALHGLMVAGLCLSKQHAVWLRVLALGLLTAKLIQEQSPTYSATDIQALVPVPIAVDAHLYGAIAGLVFVLLNGFAQRIKGNR